MRIACPTCNAAYEVAAERLAPGRAVRCARCGTLWAPVAAADAEPPVSVPAEPEPPAPEPAPEVSPEPPPETAPEPSLPEPSPSEPEADVAVPVRRPLFVPVAAASPQVLEPAYDPSKPPGRRGGVLLAVAWVASLAVLVALVWAAWVFRAAVMQAWPASERLYGWFGR